VVFLLFSRFLRAKVAVSPRRGRRERCRWAVRRGVVGPQSFRLPRQRWSEPSEARIGWGDPDAKSANSDSESVGVAVRIMRTSNQDWSRQIRHSRGGAEGVLSTLSGARLTSALVPT